MTGEVDPNELLVPWRLLSWVAIASKRCAYMPSILGLLVLWPYRMKYLRILEFESS